jgi:hypothetical protein
VIQGKKEKERKRKRRPYFVDETEKGRMPGQKGRGAGVALETSGGSNEGR